MSATGRAQKVLDSVFAHDGKAAVYAPPTGPSIACLVLLDSEDREVGGFGGRPVTRGDVIEVRSSEVGSPVKGATFTMTATGGVLTIQDAPRHHEDPERLVWTMTVS